MEFTRECNLSLKIQVAGETDIGGGKENQDAYFIWQRPAERVFIVAVLDGHGRDVGKLAAESGKEFLITFFDEHYGRIEADPVGCMTQALMQCHQHIKSRFRDELTRTGWEVNEAPEGYLLKRRAPSSNWLCVHGGTSCSIAALVGGKLYLANVGDSSGLLCASQPVFRQGQLLHLGDASRGDSFVPRSSDADPSALELTDTLVVTAEHSPESVDEFHRMQKFRCDEQDPRLPSLRVVYDAPGQEKVRCPPVFRLGEGDVPEITNNGAYYKNVRKEWASLVATPPSARFQDALAFTRSLGDLHLQIYGIFYS